MSYQHAVGSPEHETWRVSARQEVERIFAGDQERAQPVGPFGSLRLPYRKMGAVDSLNLFDIEELILFSFYWHNRKRYRRVADLGANIGLHSLVMDKCGYAVRAFEPDHAHVEILQENLRLNGCNNVEVQEAAVSDRSGSQEFVRVLGNTTGSHLAGAKPNPYGELERFTVPTVSITEIMAWADLIKADVEGHEAVMLKATTAEDWDGTDMLVEIGSRENARAVFEHLTETGVNLFSQKINWQQVQSAGDMPESYTDGTLFISKREEMPWPVRERVTYAQ